MRTGRTAERMSAALIVAVAAVAAGQAGAQTTRPASEPTTGPASRPAATLAERIQPFLKVIHDSDDYRAVMRAYARAIGLDRANVPVHTAYMRRMLRMGLPQIAYYPGQTLTNLDRGNGTAWGVVGYHHGKRGRLVEAFRATMQAVELKGDDPSILHNAGQLAAWYDEDPSLPKVPDSARRRLAKLRQRLDENPIFARAYKQVAQAYRKRGQAAKGLADEIAQAETAVESARLRALAVDRELRRLNEQIDHRNRLIDQLWRELRRYYGTRTYRDQNGNVIVLPPRDPARRRELYDRIREEERATNELKLQVRQARRDGEAVLQELARKQKALRRLRRKVEAQRRSRKSIRDFRWDPPAVDGVVTNELDGLPPVPARAKPELPIDPESEADQRLELAKLYLRHDMSGRAVDILEEINRRFASTRAGRQAKVLLAALKPSP